METDLAHGGDITYQIIGLAMRVHRRLGPGLLELVYEACLCHELRRSETPFQRQVRLPVLYDDADWIAAMSQTSLSVERCFSS